MHRVLNFGSVLQAYALQQAVNELGFKSEIIDYQFPNSEHLMYLKKNEQKSDSIPFRLRLSSAIRRKLCGSKLSEDDVRRGKFQQFIGKYLKISEESFSDRFQIDEASPLYDIYLTGSDQVWNPSYVGYDTTFMCGFARNTNPRVSFAASMAIAKIPDQFVDYYRKELSQYSAISVREETAIGIVSNLTGKTVSLVCDPTMLLTKKEWLDKFQIIESNKYFIVYILDYTYNPYPYIFDIIEKCHQRYGGEIIVLSGQISPYMKRNGAVTINTASPIDFIRYFAYASFVVTSSFHGTIFSLNFNIPFVSVVDDRIGRDSRVVDLLKRLKAERFKQIYTDPIDENKEYSYTLEIIESIEKFRSISLEFLDKSLRNAVLL